MFPFSSFAISNSLKINEHTKVRQAIERKKNKTKQNEVKASAMTCPGFQAISMLVLLFIQYLARFIWGPIWLLKNTCKPNTI